MPDLIHLPADAATDEIMSVLNRDGALILDDVISAAAADQFREELRPYVEATRPGQDSFTGRRTTRTGALVARSQAAREAVMDRRIRAICDRVLLPNCERYQLHLTQLIRIMPGEPAQAIHRDRWAWGKYLKGIEPQLNTIWALSDFTEANGATRIVPGSHRLASVPRYGGEVATVAATMSAGSVMLFDSALWHHGGANTTDSRRYAISCYYCAGWLRQQENLQLGIPQDMAARFPRRLQELLGYSIYKGQYGHIDNRDPITLLGQAGRPTVWEASDERRTGRPARDDAPAA